MPDPRALVVGGLFAVVRRPTNVALLLGGSVARDVRLHRRDVLRGRRRSAATLALRPDRRDLPRRFGDRERGADAGGLGALEAAVIAGLVAAGMPNDIAVPSVFLFRLGTFWLPILPGWGAFTYMQREDYL